MRASLLLGGHVYGPAPIFVRQPLLRAAAAFAVCLASASLARAATPVTSADLTGARTTPTSPGIVGSGGYGDASGGLKIAWSISFEGNYWSYSYTIKNKDGTTLSPLLSHLLLEVSPVITSTNVGGYIYDTNFTFEGPQTWTKDPNYPNTTNPGKNGGNPNLPANVYAIRILSSQPTYTFKSTQAPMWGDFYTKDGKTNGVISTAWTSAFGTEPAAGATSFTGWIPVPDTTSVERCDDGSDNDGDHLIDCADPDCNGRPCQQDGSFCTGRETCSGGTCQSDGNPCTGDLICSETGARCVACVKDADCPAGAPFCKLDTNTCVPCLTNGDCDDGLYCNGEETCDANTCTPGQDPCNGQFCDEQGDTCGECLSDTDCPGGLVCDVEQHKCVACTKDDDCPGDARCKLDTNTCVPCLGDGDCDDGFFCTGQELCTGNTCQPGSPPCAGNVCDEAGDQCVECLENEDCGPGRVCDLPTHTCKECLKDADCPAGAPFCKLDTNTCVPCLTNGDCDNTLFCDGQETCAANTCQPGNPPCTGQVCSEAEDKCADCFDDGDCTGGLVCDLGTQTCVACNDDGDCPAGAPFCKPDHTCVPCLTNGDCDDAVFCNGDETCTGDTCQPGTAPCTGKVCDEQGKTCTGCATNADCDDTLFCTGGETCVANVCVPGSDPCPGQLCDDTTDGCVDCLTNADCDDQIACTVDECLAGSSTCSNTASDDLCPSTACSIGSCDVPSKACRSTPTNEDGVCDDGNPCTTDDRCVNGSCEGSGNPCGDNVVQDACGEECDPPNSAVCDDSCHFRHVCVGPIAPPGIDCLSPNAPASACDPCDLVCLPGSQPAIRYSAQRIAFISTEDYTGENGDHNPELFLFDLRHFKARLRKGANEPQALLDSVAQVTDTHLDGVGQTAVNERPTLNGSGRFVAFVSSADVAGDANSDDGNKELFEFQIAVQKNPSNRDKIAVDVKERLRITATPSGDNLHPTLRGLRGNLLLFDSPSNLVPDRCSGGTNDRHPCASDAECAGGSCGNTEGNREIFLWVRRNFRNGGIELAQITTAPDGESTIGNSVGSKGRSAAFSSDADLVGNNPQRLRQIFTAIKTSANLFQVTDVIDPIKGPVGAVDPSQTKSSLLAFASDADFGGGNGGHKSEIFLWRKRGAPQVLQITESPGASCASGLPAMDSSSRFIGFESTCDVLPGHSNPGKSIFIYDEKRDGFLDLTLRVPGNDDDASRPLVTKGAARVVFELVPKGTSDPEAVCVFESQKDHLTHFVPR